MKSRSLLSMLAFVLFTSGCTSTNVIERKHYNAWEKDVGYTQVVQVGKTLHLAGITSDATTFAEQLTSIYNQIGSILADYGVGSDRISKEVIYTTDIELMKETIPLRKEFYSQGLYPSSSWVQVTGLFSPDFMLEIAVTVDLP